MKVTFALLIAALIGFSVNAEAGTWSLGVNHRQHNQQHRIWQGVRSGELTGREFRRLQVEQRAIRHKERVFKSDGQLTGWERANLHRGLNRAGRDIYRQKHDGKFYRG
ncbi:MAG: hypothetical protein V2J55_04250 [Candidatus Competibacteraceae bacterium]|nr:hypothetical protein [Candidatus Competibacteraceae bacterium]